MKTRVSKIAIQIAFQIILFLICFIVLTWLLAFIHTETLTHKHAGEYTDYLKAYYQVDNDTSLDVKILDYNPLRYAKLYVILDKQYAEELIITGYDNTKTVVYSDTLWSKKGGNADRTVWPYWWQAF